MRAVALGGGAGNGPLPPDTGPERATVPRGGAGVDARGAAGPAPLAARPERADSQRRGMGVGGRNAMTTAARGRSQDRSRRRSAPRGNSRPWSAKRRRDAHDSALRGRETHRTARFGARAQPHGATSAGQVGEEPARLERRERSRPLQAGEMWRPPERRSDGGGGRTQEGLGPANAPSRPRFPTTWIPNARALGGSQMSCSARAAPRCSWPRTRLSSRSRRASAT